MIIVVKLLIIYLILFCQILSVQAMPGWLNATLSGLASLFNSCLEVPLIDNFTYGTTTLNLTKPNVWINTGNQVQANKSVMIDWSTIGAEVKPRKYKVLYRVDPRFQKPQIFIQQYDYNQQKYISDFHYYKNGQLNKYQINPDMVFKQRINDYTNYFNFIEREFIPIYAGEVVNISLISINEFFDNSDQFVAELDHYSQSLAVAYSASPIQDNSIIYAKSDVFCAFLQTSAQNVTCVNNTYLDNTDNYAILIGKPAAGKLNSVANCPAGATSDQVLCAYDKGRGVVVSVGEKKIKDLYDNFLYSPLTGKYFLYYYADNGGVLNFSNYWGVDSMFVNNQQFMRDWQAYNDTDSYKTSIQNIAANYLHFGRYIMLVEVGSGQNDAVAEEQSKISVEYAITSGEIPSSGTMVNYDDKFDATQNGYLWLKINNPSTEIQGAITVKYAHYTGTTIFSDIIYNNLIIPIRDKFQQVTKQFYTKLVTDPTLQRIGYTMLTLYVLLYGLFFIIGMVEVTVNDIVIRVIKVGVILQLFSPSSWSFFNEHLFQMFLSGADYLMSSASGAVSSTQNIFGFVDPILDRYTNPRLWGLLFLQLLQLQNGLFVFAAMAIYAVIIYCRAIIEVIISYCIAFVSMCVLISLAPLFIILILFSRTRGIFDKWISSLFIYMLQPTILLIFFLLIDQVITTQLNYTITRACWGCFIPLSLALDLNNLGIPISFSFTLPFLPCIPFFVTQVTELQVLDQLYNGSSTFLRIASSTLIFYFMCLMSYGLVNYVNQIIAQLTGAGSVLAISKTGGNVDKGKNQVESILSDVQGVSGSVANRITRGATKVFNKAKEKLYDSKEKNNNAEIPKNEKSKEDDKDVKQK